MCLWSNQKTKTPGQVPIVARSHSITMHCPNCCESITLPAAATKATTFDNSVSLNVERRFVLSVIYQLHPNAVVTTAAMRPRHDCDSTVVRQTKVGLIKVALCVGRIAVPLQSRCSCNRCIRHHQARSRTSQYHDRLTAQMSVFNDSPESSWMTVVVYWRSRFYGTLDYPSLNFTLLRLRYGHARRQSDAEKGFG